MKSQRQELDKVREAGEPSTLVARVVRTQAHLEKARSVRVLRYKSWGYANLVEQPDTMDYDPHAMVLLVEDRVSGLPLATIRVETGRGRTFHPAESFDIPERIPAQSSAYLTRLAAVPGPVGRKATLLVLKAAYRYCIAIEIKWMLAYAVPPMDRRYKSLGFSTLPECPEPVPYPQNPDILGKLMACNLFDIERTWRESAHPNYAIFFGEPSSELEIFSSLKPAWLSPRIDGPGQNPTATPPEGLDFPVI